ncbi:MAG: hypothetical protein IJP11_05745 [Oscillospiraceae bacterium]|nr:hypothetical protein [Oscillospiraceae bacterium]
MSKNETRRLPQVPDIKQRENEIKKPLPDLRFILLGAGMTLLLMLILFLLLFLKLGERTPKGPFRYREEAAAEFPLQEGAAFKAHRGGILAAGKDGFTLYDAGGGYLGGVRHYYETPLLLSGGSLGAVCDLGGSRLSVLDAAGRAVMDLTTDGTILDADLSSGDALCYAETLPGYKAVLTVYDKKQNQIYRWYSASRYMTRCAVSEDAKLLCAAAIEEEELQTVSAAVLFETDVEVPLAEVPLGEQMIWELRFLDRDTVCAVGDHAAVYFTPKGELLGSYDYSGMNLMDYSAEGDGFTALILNKYQAGNSNTLVLLDSTGSLLAERYLGEEVLSVSAAGGFCAVQTPEHLYVYDKSLQLCAVTEASASAICADGSAIVRNGNGVQRRVPE